ncbi:MAG: ABC transporter ATP-binding protein [Flavobacteriales bacterium]
MSFLELNQLTKSFESQQILNQLDVAVNKGEILALLGNSGCGKSTLLRLLAGFENADSGDIRLESKSILKLKPHQREIGMFFQEYALFPHLNVEENIAFGLKTNKRERVKTLLELCQLQGFEKKQIHQLSGGQKQRVALARALAPEPKILLLDEPFSNIDAQLKEQLRSELKTLVKKAKVTAILVSHDIEDAFCIADRLVVMNNGFVEQIGEPEAVYRQPKTPFVAQFLGDGFVIEGEIKESKLISSDGLCFDVAKPTTAGRSQFFVRPEDLELIPDAEGQFQIQDCQFARQVYRVQLKQDISLQVNQKPNDLSVNYKLIINTLHKFEL